MLSHGQSPWLDFISRELVESGELARMVAAKQITGLTSNPSIFEKAFAASSVYADEVQRAARDGVANAYDAFVRIAIRDIQGACDALAPVYAQTGGVDGFVSLEIPPGIESDVDRSVSEAQRLAALVARPNLMVKVPATSAGIRALEELIAAGINVNQTLLFSTDVYVQTAGAYIRGLERRALAGEPLNTVTSVASFFVSRLDTAVDTILPADSPLRGQIAVANARDAYRRFLQLFAGARWEALERRGAHLQRPLWASTSTKNPAYSDVLYVEALVAPHTVNTLPEPTLRAFLDHGSVSCSITVAAMREAGSILQRAREAGIDMRAVTSRLLAEGLASFEADFRKLLDRVGEGLRTAAPVSG